MEDKDKKQIEDWWTFYSCLHDWKLMGQYVYVTRDRRIFSCIVKSKEEGIKLKDEWLAKQGVIK